MGKNKKKRKDKPSSSGEDSFADSSFTASFVDDEHLKQKFHKQSEKKAKLDTMALSQSGTSIENLSLHDIMKRLDTLETTLRGEMTELVAGIRSDLEKNC